MTPHFSDTALTSVTCYLETRVTHAPLFNDKHKPNSPTPFAHPHAPADRRQSDEQGEKNEEFFKFNFNFTLLKSAANLNQMDSARPGPIAYLIFQT
mmetsp:Transcript_50860/g.133273  ORF Transcript_50860/g.133273 Transcript_50860/m.133273 type:complete len:96 (-) Transcript_50860:152-439(-)